VDGRRPSAGSVRQGQFAAFDPEPLEEDDEPVDGEEGEDDEDEEDDEEEGDEDDDSVEVLLGVEPPEVPVLDALSLALAAFRLSVR
jgi:hypothetical protein